MTAPRDLFEITTFNINHKWKAVGLAKLAVLARRTPMLAICVQEGRWLGKLPAWAVPLVRLFRDWPAVPILVDKQAVVLGHDQRLLTKASLIDPDAAGPTLADEKRANYVILQRPGGKLAIVNMHRTPSRWDPAAHALQLRQSAEAANLVRELRAQGCAVVLTMDGNDVWQAKSFDALRDAGLRRISDDTPTMNGKPIDHVLVTPELAGGRVTVRAGVTKREHKSVTVEVSDSRTPREDPPMSGICPFAVKKLIPPGANDPRIKPRLAILHVDAGNADSLYEYFRDRSGGVESHFHVKKSGTIEQYRDIYYEADANYLANGFAVSIETQGFGEGEWTPEQLASIFRLLLWLHEEAGIPLVKASKWDGAGVGYHIQFGTPGKWTNVSKSCPGPDRIKQFNRVIVPQLAKLDDPEPVKGYTERGNDELREAIGNLRAAAAWYAKANSKHPRSKVKAAALGAAALVKTATVVLNRTPPR